MKKKLSVVALTAILLIGLSPFTASANADRVKIERVVDVSDLQANKAVVQAIFIDGANSNVVDEPMTTITVSNPVSATPAFLTDLRNWAVGYASTNLGATISPSNVVWDGWGLMNSTQFASLASTTQVTSLIATATSSVTSAYTAAIAAAIPAAPASYQTIVSQTGTAAPAAAGGLTPMNSYSGSPTFTWARTGAGVYTLTASSAVFNTSGKTGVFVAPLQNLNASVRATVTSSTVITITTAVQSVAVLGLLGLTATPTDALLSGTMIYVQTYP